MITRLLSFIKRRIFSAEYARIAANLDKADRYQECLFVTLGRAQEKETQLLREIDRVGAEHASAMNELRDFLSKTGMREQIATCYSKRQYGSREAAQFASLARFYKDGWLLREYECMCCARWHLTTTDKPSKLVREELVYKSHLQSRMHLSIAEILKEKT